MPEKISKAIHIFEHYFIYVFSKTVSFVFSVFWTVLWLPMSIKYALAASYFPEEKHKNVIVRISENLVWTIRHQRANKFYTLYGFDVTGKSSKEYVDENEFWKGLNKLNYKSASGGVVIFAC